MTNPNATNYRDIGDVPLAVVTALLTAAKSPMVPTLSATYAAVKGNTALFFAQAYMENVWETTGIVIHPEDHNPVSLRPWTDDPTATVTGDLIDSVTRAKVGTITVPPGAIGAILEPDKSMMLRFSSDAGGAREWQRRTITDPTYKNAIYTKAVTLEQMIDIYCPPGDIHPVTGNDANATYAPTVRAKLAEFAAAEAKLAPITQTGDTTVTTTALTFGKVPMPKITDHQSLTKNKPEGVGWNNLGKRTPKFLVIHRMEGNLSGTDAYFPMASTGALTDYGIGTAGIDGSKYDGTIMQWNDPRGYRAGWASGPVSAPYGDGLKWLNWGYAHGYDVNFVNICGVSVEHSGDYNDPFSDVAFAQSAALVAYWFDQFQVPYDKAPIGPDGISCITWHQEWTIGTGKICPGPWLMDQTQELIDAAAVILKQYQTGDTSVIPIPPPVVVPTATYAKPGPIAKLAPYGIKDKDTAKAIVTAEGTKFTWVADTYKVTKQTKRYQFASLKAPSVGPDLKVDETLDILWTFTAANGSLWGYTAAATRIDLSCVERVKD